ncbi:hypothetical protein M427DRAFT_67595 [Gonapodya prolifera JEL478]|uniref:Acyl-CoA thioesterase-like C-terminal domain-containing protein n=1 Tax=Gonapodya prolifera (strain JEL478) TaxID=1344416 RepID=A0A139AQP7_GONPJ|nr:hypothetical protein M427DRAFT_67595 [Gonapodya prolifera JEL478]|eukprot:KXS19042.1 hypothetical protein M427DRAFT_67595 [Gonapodya prolifera JEL478]
MGRARGAAEPPFSALRDFRISTTHTKQVEDMVTADETSGHRGSSDLSERQRRFDFPSYVWGGFRTPRKLDTIALIWLLDAIVPLNLALALSPASPSHLVGWSTLSYSIHFFNAGHDNGTHAIVDAALTWTHAGQAELVVTAWNREGKILAVGKQLGVLAAREKAGGVSSRAKAATRL